MFLLEENCWSCKQSLQPAGEAVDVVRRWVPPQVSQAPSAMTATAATLRGDSPSGASPGVWLLLLTLVSSRPHISAAVH